MLRGLDRKPASLPKEMVAKPSFRAWRAPVSAADARYPVHPEQVFRPKSKPGSPGQQRDKTENKPIDTPKDTSRGTSRTPSMTKLTLGARSLKITVPLDAAEVRALPNPSEQARCQLAIACEGKIYTADIATKALRKAKGVISANGAMNVFCMIQGKLKNNEIIECGLVAQVKTPKPSVE
jgi:hypothetical protein